jgi:signal transduction histidine kinase
MIGQCSVRRRLIISFCITAGALLAVSYSGLFVVFRSLMLSQFDHRISEVAAPIIADLAADPEDKDVDLLNIADEYFEVLDPAGSVLQRSRNLPLNLPITTEPGYQSVHLPGTGEIRAVVLPFRSGTYQRLFVGAASTREVEESLAALRRFGLILLPASLLLTTAVFGVYSSHLLGRVEAVMRQLRQFVSDASHELRTPLSVLQGETELLLARRRTAEEHEAAARVMESEVKKLNRIVDGLFTLSMADAGQLQIAPQLLYLEEVLDESCCLAMPLASYKKIRIDRRLQDDVLFNGDATFLRQLFFIFLDNAIKYSPSGSHVLVTLAKTDDVRVCFRDQGIGIAANDVPHIFERFFRAGPPTETQSGGLGLAIARAIVDAHHGTIECESEIGRGSTFTVRLPVTKS